MQKLLFTLIAIFILSTAWSAEGDYGRYCVEPKISSRGLKETVQIDGTDTPSLYRSLAPRPVYYLVEAPAGKYQVTIHYLAPVDLEKGEGKFSVQVDGEQKVPETPCFTYPKKMPEVITLKAQTVDFQVEVKDQPLKIDFPRDYGQEYLIAGIEVVGQDFELRINCGSKQDTVDAQDQLWKKMRHLPMPMPVIQLDPDDTTNAWVNISDEMLKKLHAHGVVPVPKWGGRFVHQSNGMFYDRSGHVYINFAGVGMWEYGGPGGTLKRIDGGRYTSVCKAESINPYEPGYVLFCSHGYNNKDTYQALSWDGVNLETWPTDGDVGAVDWSDPAEKKLIFWKPRHGNKLAISKDGGKTHEIVAEPKYITNLGALGNGVLVYCTGAWEPGKADGIYRSEDLGKTWEKVYDKAWFRRNVNCSSVFAYEDRAYLQCPDGLLKSTDRGKTWRLVPDSPAFTYALQPGADGDKHMLGLSKEGVFETFDYGETWTKVTDPPPTPEDQMWIQSHSFYDFAWDFQNDVIYCSAPDLAWRYQRK